VESKRGTRCAVCPTRICLIVLGPLIILPNGDSSVLMKPGLQLRPSGNPQCVSQQSALLYNDYGSQTNDITYSQPPPPDDSILSPNETLMK